MATLRVHSKTANYTTELRQQILGDIEHVDNCMEKLVAQKKKLQEDLLSLDIAPFKLGEYAMCYIPSGRNTKLQKCLLECVNGILYARPVAKDGTLSNRHFSIVPINVSYQTLLKKVED